MNKLSFGANIYVKIPKRQGKTPFPDLEFAMKANDLLRRNKGLESSRINYHIDPGCDDLVHLNLRPEEMPDVFFNVPDDKYFQARKIINNAMFKGKKSEVKIIAPNTLLLSKY